MTGALTIEHVVIGDLRPDSFNPRRISDAELESLTRSIQEFGLVAPLIARSEDRTVIGGHQRSLAARRLGMTTVPVVFVDLTLEQAKLLNLALNRISGEWDQELLARLLQDLQQVPDVDLTLSGFAEDEISKLLKSLEARDKRDRPESFDLEAPWKPHAPTQALRGATSGSWVTTASCAAMPPTAPTCRAWWAHSGLPSPSPTHPTTWTSATTGEPREAAADAPSPTTPCPRKSGRASAAPGPSNSSTTWTAPSTSA